MQVCESSKRYQSIITTHIRCGGCGQICGKEKGDRCRKDFCFWNSWYTERIRALQDKPRIYIGGDVTS